MIRTFSLALLLGVASSGSAQEAVVDPAVGLPAPNDRLAADLEVAELSQPEDGYRFAKLTPAQRRALRPRFRLPMEALFQVTTPRDLRAAAEVQPVPDPHRPLLPVKGEEGSGNPFAESQTDVSKFDVLNKLFAAELAAASAAGEEGNALTDPGGLDDDFASDDAFAPVDTTEDAAAETPAEDFDDPFADF